MPSADFWFAFVYPYVSPEDPEGQKCIFLFLYQRKIQFIKVFRVFREITGIYTITPNQVEEFLFGSSIVFRES
tara:strand:+ start:257 stop:475 length:219 start_codon:yes stop_codon:yes gene_type:complete